MALASFKKAGVTSLYEKLTNLLESSTSGVVPPWRPLSEQADKELVQFFRDGQAGTLRLCEWTLSEADSVRRCVFGSRGDGSGVKLLVSLREALYSEPRGGCLADTSTFASFIAHGMAHFLHTGGIPDLFTEVWAASCSRSANLEVNIFYDHVATLVLQIPTVVSNVLAAVAEPIDLPLVLREQNFVISVVEELVEWFYWVTVSDLGPKLRETSVEASHNLAEILNGTDWFGSVLLRRIIARSGCHSVARTLIADLWIAGNKEKTSAPPSMTGAETLPLSRKCDGLTVDQVVMVVLHLIYHSSKDFRREDNLFTAFLRFVKEFAYFTSGEAFQEHGLSRRNTIVGVDHECVLTLLIGLTHPERYLNTIMCLKFNQSVHVDRVLSSGCFRGHNHMSEAPFALVLVDLATEKLSELTSADPGGRKSPASDTGMSIHPRLHRQEMGRKVFNFLLKEWGKSADKTCNGARTPVQEIGLTSALSRALERANSLQQEPSSDAQDLSSGTLSSFHGGVGVLMAGVESRLGSVNSHVRLCGLALAESLYYFLFRTAMYGKNTTRDSDEEDEMRFDELHDPLLPWPSKDLLYRHAAVEVRQRPHVTMVMGATRRARHELQSSALRDAGDMSWEERHRSLRWNDFQLNYIFPCSGDVADSDTNIPDRVVTRLLRESFPRDAPLMDTMNVHLSPQSPMPIANHTERRLTNQNESDISDTEPIQTTETADPPMPTGSNTAPNANNRSEGNDTDSDGDEFTASLPKLEPMISATSTSNSEPTHHLGPMGAISDSDSDGSGHGLTRATHIRQCLERLRGQAPSIEQKGLCSGHSGVGGGVGLSAGTGVSLSAPPRKETPQAGLKRLKSTLRRVPWVIRQSESELKDLAVPLAQALIDLRFGYDNAVNERLVELRYDSFVALGVAQPLQVFRFLSNQAFGPNSAMDQRLHVFSVMQQCARELGGLVATESSSSIKVSKANGGGENGDVAIKNNLINTTTTSSKIENQTRLISKRRQRPLVQENRFSQIGLRILGYLTSEYTALVKRWMMEVTGESHFNKKGVQTEGRDLLSMGCKQLITDPLLIGTFLQTMATFIEAAGVASLNDLVLMCVMALNIAKSLHDNPEPYVRRGCLSVVARLRLLSWNALWETPHLNQLLPWLIEWLKATIAADPDPACRQLALMAQQGLASKASASSELWSALSEQS
eukprot:GHVN01074150.1.p1 GENE.GHVN01074150.1~~GHVN01074150.1.p1  ORF type:complete len:1190 (-),score=132.37 GHVN01074150.1:1839-5408(-)